MPWQVDFFADERGHAPVEEYLTGLPVQHRAKALALIKMLEQHGPSLPFPYSSQLRGKLRELRTQQGKDKLRILYFGDARRVFVLLHGILKRSTKLPEEDIGIAVARMELHERRREGRKK
jgi:phage-related protein